MHETGCLLAGDSMAVPVELTASNGNKNTFTFDQVFGPTASQVPTSQCGSTHVTEYRLHIAELVVGAAGGSV